ncbi:histidine--tRNA ligase [Candidatus Woesearchaeota archaeon]|nr:histidine--tRNA ligase [Candidatus Woesearchaeota archaeon]
MNLQLPKGTRDFPPEEKILRDKLIGSLKVVFERYGFNPLETPMFERFDVLGAKYAGGAEILKETFKFQDQGKRDLALRYDLTVPFARFVGMNPQLKFPFKRYAIGRVFRDGPIKLGRYREFYQCDVDVVGSKSMLADAECVRIAVAGFKELGVPVTISVNNRKLLDELLEKGGVQKEKVAEAMLVLDKIKKVGLDEVKKELKEKGINEDSVNFIVELSTQENTNQEKIAKVKAFLGDETEGLKELSELFSYLEGVENVKYDPSLARGLEYYTGTVFEGFAKESKVTSSICGGGRYDNMVPALLESKLEYPAVGISFGLEPIMDVLKEQEKETKKTIVKAFVIPIKNGKECIPIVEQLRAAGISADMDLNGKSISKNLDYANSYGIPFVLICGPKELEQGKVKLKDMTSGDESMLSVEDAVKRLK